VISENINWQNGATAQLNITGESCWFKNERGRSFALFRQ